MLTVVNVHGFALIRHSRNHVYDRDAEALVLLSYPVYNPARRQQQNVYWTQSSNHDQKPIQDFSSTSNKIAESPNKCHGAASCCTESPAATDMHNVHCRWLAPLQTSSDTAKQQVKESFVKCNSFLLSRGTHRTFSDIE